VVTIRTLSQLAGGSQARPGAPAANLAAALALASLLLCGTVAASKPAEAAPKLCGDRDQILDRLGQTYEEKPQALGLSGDGGVIEVLVSPEGGWTMLLTYPRRATCIVATGEAWQTLQVAGESA
jgi:hypothetical protein